MVDQQVSPVSGSTDDGEMDRVYTYLSFTEILQTHLLLLSPVVHFPRLHLREYKSNMAAVRMTLK